MAKKSRAQRKLARFNAKKKLAEQEHRYAETVHVRIYVVILLLKLNVITSDAARASIAL